MVSSLSILISRWNVPQSSCHFCRCIDSVSRAEGRPRRCQHTYSSAMSLVQLHAVGRRGSVLARWKITMWFWRREEDSPPPPSCFFCQQRHSMSDSKPDLWRPSGILLGLVSMSRDSGSDICTTLDKEGDERLLASADCLFSGVYKAAVGSRVFSRALC